MKGFEFKYLIFSQAFGKIIVDFERKDNEKYPVATHTFTNPWKKNFFA